MGRLLLKWEAIKRAVDFWVQAMRMANDRLVKVVILEVLELGSKVRWVKDLHQCLERCGWRGLDVMALNGLTAKKGSEGAIERHCMVGSKIKWERWGNSKVIFAIR